MKWMYLSFCSVSRRFLVFLLTTLELLCILCGANVLLANHNQSASIQQPYERFLDREGYYLIIPDQDAEEEDVMMFPVFRETSLLGDWSFFRFYSYCCNVKAGDNVELSFRFIVYDDTFWDQFNPVLSSGRKRSSQSQEAVHCIATANCPVRNLQLPQTEQKVTVTGMLGELCYIPSMDAWGRNGSFAYNFYSVFDIKTEEQIILLMSETQWNRIMPHDDLVPSPHCLAIQNAPLTEAEHEKNEAVLREHGSIGIPLSVLSRRARMEREKNIQRFVPILIALILVTSFGLLCTSGIQVLQEQKITAVYCLGGMRVIDAVRIRAGECLLQIVICISVICCLWIAANEFGWITKFGLMFRWNNLAVSALIIGYMLICSLVLPYILIKTKHLHDLLREVAES